MISISCSKCGVKIVNRMIREPANDDIIICLECGEICILVIEETKPARLRSIRKYELEALETDLKRKIYHTSSVIKMLRREQRRRRLNVDWN